MKDTENIYYLGRVLVDRPYRMIRHLLLMSLICFLAFQNVYGSFNKEGFLYAYLVSVFIFSFPIYMNIYQLLPRFLGKRQFIFYWGSSVCIVVFSSSDIFLPEIIQRRNISKLVLLPAIKVSTSME